MPQRNGPQYPLNERLKRSQYCWSILLAVMYMLQIRIKVMTSEIFFMHWYRLSTNYTKILFRYRNVKYQREGIFKQTFRNSLYMKSWQWSYSTRIKYLTPHNSPTSEGNSSSPSEENSLHFIQRCIQKSQDNAHNTQVTCRSRVSR